MSEPAAVEAAIVDAHRREWALVLAATVRVAGDLDLAEECVQEAYAAAMQSWTRDGVPASLVHPRAAARGSDPAWLLRDLRCEREAPVAAEGARGDLHAGRRLAALVLVAVDHADMTRRTVASSKPIATISSSVRSSST